MYSSVNILISLIYTVMLGWFVEKSVIQAALKGGLIEEESVECRPEKVSNAVLDRPRLLRITRIMHLHVLHQM